MVRASGLQKTSAATVLGAGLESQWKCQKNRWQYRHPTNIIKALEGLNLMTWQTIGRTKC